MSSFADRAIAFNHSLALDISLPDNVRVMNPFAEDALAARLSASFYQKFYNDNSPRHLILGINPGRFGAALTGIPFTDFKRLEQACSINAEGHTAHEPSSEFVYKMIEAYGGARAFYRKFYINSVCPLGFAIRNGAGREVNYNYYNDPALFAAVKAFILRSIEAEIALGCRTELVFCMGVKNAAFLETLNTKGHFFDRIVVLPHPRYVIQYKRAAMPEMIDEYLQALRLAV